MRIPKALAEDAHLHEGQPLTVAIASKGGLIIKSARRKYKLRELIGEVTEKNRYPETEWVRPGRPGNL
ncbi:MAG: AbrB/MazE/SpoVT family DNA-binding domain-containing protein, partial [Terriglobia bacterium]